MASDQAIFIEGQYRIQPNKSYKSKIIVCAILAVAAFLIPLVWPFGYQAFMLIRAIGLMCAGYAVFDFLFRVNLTYVFDTVNRAVYQKVPGLYTRRLMSFEEVFILPETIYGEVHYVISNKKNKYGRNYPISDFFALTRKGKEKQTLFETEVLDVITEVLSK
jgi:hypothetical protein